MASLLDPGQPANGRTKEGLGDKRVVQVDDGGHGFYRGDRQPDEGDTQNAMSAVLSKRDDNIFRQTQQEIRNFLVYYPPNCSNSKFLPLDQLDKIMSLRKIRTLVATMSCCEALSPDEREQFAKDIRFGGGSTGRCREPCVKLLAALVWSDLANHFLSLVDDGVNDGCFPLKPPDLPGTGYKLGCRHEHAHDYLSGLNATDSRDFCSKAHHLSAPYFKWTPSSHAHYILGVDDTLPIVPINSTLFESVRDSEGNQRKSGTKPTLKAFAGGFAKVDPVTFHPSHFNFGEYGDGHKEGHHVFALKFLDSPKVEDFDLELASLLSCENNEKMHIIQLLATIEIRSVTGNGERKSKFGLIFPWADMNLWDFWKKYPGKDDRVSRCLWMAEQCYCLALALGHIHNARYNTMQHFRLSGDDKTLYGRHGDIKAENILYFKRSNRLDITDLGLGRLHTKISRSIEPHNTPMTVSYAAPEFGLTDGRVSRACDIFALGCTYLEFVTWYLLGGDAVDKFTNYRLDEDHLGFVTDTFYHLENGNGNSMTPKVKPKVQEWINRHLKQSPFVSQYILDFLRLIERMLAPLPKDRIGSELLQRDLWNLLKSCREGKDYYQKPIPHSEH